MMVHKYGAVVKEDNCFFTILTDNMFDGARGTKEITVRVHKGRATVECRVFCNLVDLHGLEVIPDVESSAVEVDGILLAIDSLQFCQGGTGKGQVSRV